MNNIQIGSDTPCSSSVATFNLFSIPANLSEGSNTFKATHINNGESGVSGTLTVTLDTVAPSAPDAPVLDAGSDTGTNGDYVTSDYTPTFTVSNCENLATVSITADGLGVLDTAICSGGSASVTIDSYSMSDDTYEIRAKQADPAGNVTSETANLTVTIDTVAPTTSGAPNMTDATDSGSLNSDNTTNDSTPTFTGSCTGANTVRLYDDGVASGSSVACSGGVFSATTGTLATGANSITFKETDAAGNTSSASTALSPVTIDTTDPIVSLTAPDADSTVSGASVTISASASDTNLVGVQFKYNTNTLIGVEDTTSTYGVTWDTTALSDGDQTLIAVARDTAGNYATSTARTVSILNTVSGGGSSATRSVTGGTVYTNSASTQTPTTPTPTPVVPPAPVFCPPGHLFSTLTGQPCTTVTPTPITPTITPPTTPTPTETFTKDLYFPLSDLEVKLLQQFLNTHGFIVARSGNGSPGQEITRFGPATRTALIAFQRANGIRPSIGYFGPLTRNFVNNILSSKGL
jgi:hypothetical protein